jgi:vacuolar-type H+-ATPase subunit E/Vma4
VVRCPPGWTKVLKATLANRPAVRVEAVEGLGAGVVICAADGSVEIDATLENRLGRLWPGIAIELLRDGAPPS